MTVPPSGRSSGSFGRLGGPSSRFPVRRLPPRRTEDDRVTDPVDRDRVFGQEDHVRIYGQDYPERLRAAGFRVEVHNAATTLGRAQCRRYALCPEENVYLCRKTAGP